MNFSQTCPSIPDNWRGNITEACKVLGGEKPISRTTLEKYMRIPYRLGGIQWYTTRKGRKMFTGKDIKRFWTDMH